MRAVVQDRVLAGVGTALVVAGLGVVLVFGLSVDMRTAAEHALAVIDIRPPPPPPPPPIEPPRVAHRAKDKPAPRNLRNKATPVVAPVPIVIPPKPPPIVTAPKPDIGAAAHGGASDRPGPGDGAGGRGNGNGGGGDGEGDGDDTPPEQIGGRLKASDVPLELLASGVDYTVGVRYGVDTTGHIDRCEVTHSSGKPLLDERVCALIQHRFRFRPSRDPDGHPVHSTVEENETFGIDRSDYPNDGR